MLGEGLADVQELRDVAEVTAYPDEQLGWRCAGVGNRQRVDGLLDPLQRGGADIATPLR